jgi:hypothetical protein
MFKEEPWKALVGSNKVVSYVHPGVLQHGISALAVRISGAWKDSSDKTLDWSDFDEETINCVLSYQYSGTYDLPGSSKDKEPTSQSTPSLQSQFSWESNQLKTQANMCLQYKVPSQKLPITYPHRLDSTNPAQIHRNPATGTLRH